MADKQPRQISRRRLYNAIMAVVVSNELDPTRSTVDDLLEAIKDEWFQDAK